MGKMVDVAEVLRLSKTQDMGTIQEQLSPEAREKFNIFLAKYLTKRGLMK